MLRRTILVTAMAAVLIAGAVQVRLDAISRNGQRSEEDQVLEEDTGQSTEEATGAVEAELDGSVAGDDSTTAEIGEHETTDESDAFSKDMKRRGFKFFGSTICYAHMQAIGMVNDHTTDCFRHRELKVGKNS